MYCIHCGKEIADDAAICINCGRVINEEKLSSISKQTSEDGKILVAFTKIFMIIACVINAYKFLVFGFQLAPSGIVLGILLAIIPLAWCVPMTVSYYLKIKNKQKIGIVFKILTLVFVSKVCGVLMLFNNEN